MTTKNINKTIKTLGNAEDRLISLHGQTAARERAEQRLKELSGKRDTSGLTADELAELDEITEQLQEVTSAEVGELAKSLNSSVSNFLRRRARRGHGLMAKSLRNDQVVVIRTGRHMVTSELFLKAADAFNYGRISGQEFNVIDLHCRQKIGLPDDLLNKINK